MSEFDFFGQAEDIQEKVESGEISGFAPWDDHEGECELLAVETSSKDGKKYIGFLMKHEKYGTRDWLMRLPAAEDKDNAKFMAMARIKKTLYPVLSEEDKGKKLSEAFQSLKNELELEGSLLVKYRLREYKSINQRTGQEVTNQSLEELDVTQE